MDCHMIGSQTAESEQLLKKWFAGPTLTKSAAPNILTLAGLDGPSTSKMQFYLDGVFTDEAAADAFVKMLYGPTMWAANQAAGSTWCVLHPIFCIQMQFK